MNNENIFVLISITISFTKIAINKASNCKAAIHKPHTQWFSSWSCVYDKYTEPIVALFCITKMVNLNYDFLFILENLDLYMIYI